MLRTLRTLAPIGLASLSLVTGCSFAVRSADMYRDDTSKLLASKEGEIHACYDGVVKATPGAAGKVTVKFTVEEKTGMVKDVKVDAANTTAPAPVQECLTKALVGLTLTPPDQKTGDATYAYEFTAPAGAPGAAAPGSALPGGSVNATKILR